MNPLRKPFKLDPLFPFDLTYIQPRSSQTELPNHLHDLYEIVYIHQGKGLFFINNAFYEKKEGEMFLIPGNTIHRSFPDAEHPIVSTALFFSPSWFNNDEWHNGYSPLKCFDIVRQKNHYNIKLNYKEINNILKIMSEIDNEFRDKKFGFRQAIKLYLEQILLIINRIPGINDQEMVFAQVGPTWMQKVLLEINQNPVDIGGLNELSAQAFVTSSHFARVFKTMTGMTLNHYITAKRIILAKQLLLSSDDNIENIAGNCGFTSLPMFYQKFKEFTGMTPHLYRKKETVYFRTDK